MEERIKKLENELDLLSGADEMIIAPLAIELAWLQDQIKI